MKTMYVTLEISYDPEVCDSPAVWDWKSLIGEDEYTQKVEIYEINDNPLDAASYA